MRTFPFNRFRNEENAKRTECLATYVDNEVFCDHQNVEYKNVIKFTHIVESHRE